MPPAHFTNGQGFPCGGVRDSVLMGFGHDGLLPCLRIGDHTDLAHDRKEMAATASRPTSSAHVSYTRALLN